MSNNDAFGNNNSEWITIDKIIEKFIPVIWAIIFITWLGYLLYTNVWVDLLIEVRLWLGFFISLLIIWTATTFSEKLKYFADIWVWGWILLLYWTLMYWSRATEVSSAVIPEVATLITAFIFTSAIAYFSLFRKSKVILILSMLWAYLTPFIIWQNDVWAQSISFNSYFTYFASISVVVFLIWREISIRKIIPLNMLWLFVGTSTLYNLSYTNWITELNASWFFGWEIFSAILFTFLSVFSIWSIIISSKKFEEKDEWYIAFWYIATIFWFIFNLSLLTSLWEISNTVFFILISISCFSWWHFLRDTKTRYQHTSLYAGWILAAIIGFFNIVPDLNIYSSLVIAYSSLIFGGLYVFDSAKFERILTYWLLSLAWAVLSIMYISEPNSVIENFKTLYVILALVPAMLWYSITVKSKNSHYIELAKIYSVSAIIISMLYIVVDFFKYIDIEFFIFYITTFLILIYLLFWKLTNNIKSVVLRFTFVWFLFAYIWILFGLLWDIYPAPTDIYILTNNALFSDWTLSKWIFWTLILFLGLYISRDLQKKQIENRPSFILVILWFTSLLLIVNYIIFAVINDYWIDPSHWWVRAISITIWWVLLSLYMIIIWVKKWYLYHSEKILWLILLILVLIKIAFYDMSGVINMENKIIVLMLVGWALMMFSYFIHMKWWLKESNNREDDLKRMIVHTDIDWINKLTFKVNWDKNFTAVSKNIVKIVIFVINKYWKNEFAAGELNDAYKYIIHNYKSELDTRSYNMAKNTFKNFVEKWWTITFS
jgi:hypothetical protein